MTDQLVYKKGKAMSYTHNGLVSPSYRPAPSKEDQNLKQMQQAFKGALGKLKGPTWDNLKEQIDSLYGGIDNIGHMEALYIVEYVKNHGDSRNTTVATTTRLMDSYLKTAVLDPAQDTSSKYKGPVSKTEMRQDIKSGDTYRYENGQLFSVKTSGKYGPKRTLVGKDAAAYAEENLSDAELSTQPLLGDGAEQNVSHVNGAPKED